MKRFAAVASVLVALVVVAVGALLSFPPQRATAGWLVQQIKAATGYDLKIRGTASLKFLPSPVFRFEDVELADPKVTTGPVLTAKAIHAEAGFWRLFLSRTIDRVTVEQPRITAAVESFGRPPSEAAPGGKSTSEAARLATLTIAGGTLSLVDGRAGVSIDVDGLDGALHDLSGGGIGEASLKGRGVVVRTAAGGPAARLTNVEATAKSLTSDRIAGMTIKAGGADYRKEEGSQPLLVERVEAKAESIARNGPVDATLAFDWDNDRFVGNVRLQSLADIVAGAPTSAGARITLPKHKLGFGEARAEGKVTLSGSRVAIEDGTVTLDDTRATGSITVVLAGSRPRVSGKLAAAELDLDKLLAGRPGARIALAEAATAPDAEAAEPPLSVTEALKVYMRAQLAALETATPTTLAVSAEDLGPPRAEAAVRARSAWSDEPIGVAGLADVDLDLVLSVGRLVLRGLELTIPELKTTLANDTLAIHADNLSVYGGRVTGTVTIESLGPEPKLSATLKGDGLDASRLFDAAGQKRLLGGKVAFEADLRGTGASPRRLIDTVSGRAQASMSRGTIVGYDLTGWSGILGAGKYDPSLHTPFEKLTAELPLTNGVAKNSNVRLSGTAITLNGDGAIRFPSREIDYRARVTLAAWFLPIAVRLAGPWQSARPVFDLAAFVASPEAVVNPVEALKDVNLEDPELARLADEVVKKAQATQALPPEAIRAFEAIRAKAAGQN